MKSSTLPVLERKLTLFALAEQHILARYKADDFVVVECEPGWFALLTAGALQDLFSRLQSAVNRSLAGEILHAPLGELLRPIAKQSDAPPAGPSRRPPPATADDLLRALGADPDQLDVHSQEARPPAETTDESANENANESAKELDSLDQASGGAAETSPAQPPPSLQREEIRLDVVTPETAVVDEPFDMAVAIRQPASPTLTIDDLPKLTSTMGEIYRGAGQDLIKYRVEVEVDDCDVKPARYDFLLAKGRDSIVQYFQLTPKRAGNLSIIVNAYQAESAVLAATTRVRLKAGVAVAGDAPSALAQANAVKIYDVLTSLFSLSDVDDLATRLSINPEELAGDTLSARCRSLVAYCNHRNKFDQLRQLMKTLRPEAGL